MLSSMIYTCELTSFINSPFPFQRYRDIPVYWFSKQSTEKGKNEDNYTRSVGTGKEYSPDKGCRELTLHILS